MQAEQDNETSIVSKHSEPVKLWTDVDFGRVSKPRGRRQVLPDVLVIFIHGIMSGPAIWDQWVEPLRNAVNADFDAVAFRYPSMFWQKCDIRDEAKSIYQAVQKSLGDYKHVFVVTHSMGGLVLKQIFSVDAEATATSRHLALSTRVRSIAFLAVPHYGGIPFLTWPLAAIYKYLFWPVWAPFARFYPRWGRYEPCDQLAPMNDWLCKLDADFRRMLDEGTKRATAVPLVYDAEARFDEIARSRLKDWLTAPGSDRQWSYHELGWSGHLMRYLNPAVLPTLHREIFPHIDVWGMNGPYAANALDLAAETVRTAIALDMKENEISSGDSRGEIDLVSDPARTSEAVPDGGYKRYDQLGAYEAARREIERGRDLCLVFTGQGGAGKSVVMRKLAKTLAIDYLSRRSDKNSLGTSPCLPITMNLKRADGLKQRISDYVRDGRDPETLWTILNGWWLSWASERRKETAPGSSDLKDRDRPPLTADWLATGFRLLPVVLFIDSVDEFVIRYPQIGTTDIDRLVDYLLVQNGDGTPLRIIIGVRSGMLGMEGLARNSLPPIVIAPLSLEYARRLFGEEIVSKLADLNPDDRDAILIFFILSALKRSPDVLRGDFSNVSMVFERALEAILKSSVSEKTPTEYDRDNLLLDTVSAIAWAFALNNYAEQKVATLQVHLTAIANEWDQFVAQQPGNADAMALREAARMAAGSRWLNILLARSVFTEINGAYGFSHRIWMELGVARYLARSLAVGNFEPMRQRTFYRRIFLRLGDYLNRMVFTRDFIERALNEPSQFVIGNLGAVQPYTRSPINGDGLSLIGDRFAAMPPLARHVLLGSLSHRAMRAANALDPSRDAIRDLLRERIYPQCLKRPDINAATVSLAWCLNRQMFGTDAVEPQPWPEPQEKHADDILDMACPGWLSGKSKPVQIESLQFGFADTILTCADDPIRQAASAHYLLFLVLAFRKGAATVAAQKSLKIIFGPTTSVEQIESLKVLQGLYGAPVPEIGRLVALARRIYKGEPW